MITPIAKPLSALEAEYTVVVVGSGYGAGAAASRLARAGQSVCVLERGREILPGQYPNTLTTAGAEMQVDTTRGRLGNPSGLFNVHVNPDMIAVVGCGLGGTSLINANVTLEMDPRLFDHASWPDEFRQDKTALAEFTAHAMTMLGARPYPDTFPVLNKLQALAASAQAMKQPFYRPPIAVNFEDQVNPFGVAQPRCTLCGDCTSGCNDGAKNTTLMNYLPDANNHGAHIFTRARVSHVERDGDGWRVHFQGVRDAAGDGAEEAMSVKARIVVLGAGSLGSTEILLRSRERGLPLSKQLGRRFSGNGDVLAFGYNNHWQTDSSSTPEHPAYKSLNGVGRGSNTLTAAQLPGPCITGVIDMRGAARVEDGLVIEEGVIPGAVATMLPPGGFFADALFGNFMQYGPTQAGSRLTEAQAEGNAIQNDPGNLTQMSYAGPIARTQTYLVMSVDDAGGTLRLESDRVRIDWPGAGRSDVIARDNRLLEQANDAIQGHFVPNPVWTEPQGYALVTVHPVGGCGMGNDAESGVVDHKCQVFASDTGRDVHAGLYVCDGAAMPGAVGVNPLLTITAVAERACALIARDHGWTIDYTLAPAKPLPKAAAQSPARPAGTHQPALERLKTALRSWVHEVEHTVLDEIHGAVSDVARALEDGAIDLATRLLRAIIDKYPDLLSPAFQFSERMHGFASTRPVGPAGDARERISTDFEIATAWGRADNDALSFDLCVRTDDLHRLTSDPTHPAAITGTVTCPALSEAPMRVRRGEFHLLPVDAQRVETWRMTYDMVLERAGGPVHFHGFKVLHDRPGSHWWDDVTTLYVTVREGEAGDGDLLAQGTLRLDLEDLLWQGASVRIDPSHGLIADIVNHVPSARAAIEMAYMGRFAGFFGGVLFQAYGGLLADLNNFPAQPGARPPKRSLKAPLPTVHPVALPDGFSIRLTRYQGGPKGPVILAPGFSVKASSFAIDTIDRNFVEFLTAHGYDVWLFDYRASPASGSPIQPYTIDDIACVDWPAAVAFVQQATGARDVQTLAHCVGSMSLLMALLRGMKGVRSVVSSALTLHPVTTWLNYLKVDLDLVRVMERMSALAGGFDVVPGGSLLDHEIDAVAWNVPVPAGEECKNPVCHRIFTIFGPSYTHAQLDHATHTALMEQFGRIALPPFEQLSLILARGRAVDHLGADAYVQPALAANLALPISFVTGALNQIFDPETIARTRQWLVTHNGPAHYDQHVFDGYAHMDLYIGRNAAVDVYPHLLERLERYATP